MAATSYSTTIKVRVEGFSTLTVCWNFRRVRRVLCGYSAHARRSPFDHEVANTMITVMQDVMGMVFKFFPKLRIAVYVDDMKLHPRVVAEALPQRTRELDDAFRAEIMKVEVRNSRSQRVTGRESELEVSYPYLMQKRKWFCGEEESGMDGSIEFQEIDKRNSLRMQKNTERKRLNMFKRRVCVSKKHKVFQRQYQRKGTKKLVTVGSIPARI